MSTSLPGLRSWRVLGCGLAGLTVWLAAARWALGAEPAGGAGTVQPVDARAVAAEVDRLIAEELRRSGTAEAGLTRDEDFLRRVSFDLAGRLPTPDEVTYFALNPDAHKRAELIDQLLQSDAFAESWARYWRDVIYSRATDMRARLSQPAFERWMTGQLKAGTGWDRIATELITATGPVRENGQTALMFAHGGEATEIAAETSRIFLGIQIQCANCHDHPTDQWKREQFHQLAAYFPRVRIRQDPSTSPPTFEVVSADLGGGREFLPEPDQLFARLDRNRDGKLTREEIAQSQLGPFFARVLERGDANRDQALSLAEFKALPRPQLSGRGGPAEYYMPDLSDPGSRGTLTQPVFFVNQVAAPRGLRDVDRRSELARQLTSPDNPWFARALVNRIWAEMLGRGFYMPVDDLGPERTPEYPEVLQVLSDGFVASGYDLKWLFRAIANTRAYQREIRPHDPSGRTPAFASTTPTRLRADQLYDAILGVLGAGELSAVAGGRGQGFARFPASPRALFAAVFGFDPSTPQEELTGSVPQALFMMNSPLLNRMIQGSGGTRLARILRDNAEDRDAVQELYLLVLARQPSERELQISLDYVRETGKRTEAFEDLMWSLLNSSEFLSKR